MNSFAIIFNSQVFSWPRGQELVLLDKESMSGNKIYYRLEFVVNEKFSLNKFSVRKTESNASYLRSGRILFLYLNPLFLGLGLSFSPHFLLFFQLSLPLRLVHFQALLVGSILLAFYLLPFIAALLVPLITNSLHLKHFIGLHQSIHHLVISRVALNYGSHFVASPHSSHYQQNRQSFFQGSQTARKHTAQMSGAFFIEKFLKFFASQVPGPDHKISAQKIDHIFVTQSL
ncbi:hypothetical protein BpHYR1_006414 [Brachionus plicatilis]|uniref:Uncharacterized protein n=1 Tax=Brachionus plicatilis TaxID=10195 RepID=A0A3M7P1N9_BRAPC|nr:hypothetical protein BpHYR1_006414 [Brachionus plicatilis]